MYYLSPTPASICLARLIELSKDSWKKYGTADLFLVYLSSLYYICNVVSGQEFHLLWAEVGAKYTCMEQSIE